MSVVTVVVLVLSSWLVLSVVVALALARTFALRRASSASPQRSTPVPVSSHTLGVAVPEQREPSWRARPVA